MKKILILAPHTDDGEFGCGGSICKFIQLGYKVVYVAFSSCEKSLPPNLKKDTLKKELLRATNLLGISKDNVRIYNYPVREFTNYRQDILENMISLQRELSPDIVFAPSTEDLHQDHRTVAFEAMRAFKKTCILHYELPWNNISFRNQVFIKLDESQVLKKIKSIKCYKSQKGKVYMDAKYIKGLSISHGVQIGAEYAEVFETNRWVIK